jgi:hypothetical protein
MPSVLFDAELGSVVSFAKVVLQVVRIRDVPWIYSLFPVLDPTDHSELQGLKFAR